MPILDDTVYVAIGILAYMVFARKSVVREGNLLASALLCAGAYTMHRIVVPNNPETTFEIASFNIASVMVIFMAAVFGGNLGIWINTRLKVIKKRRLGQQS